MSEIENLSDSTRRYIISSLEGAVSHKLGEKGKPTSIENLIPFQKLPQVCEPRICVWHFMSESDLRSLLKISSKPKIREAIGSKLKDEYADSESLKVIFVELLYNVLKFCKSSEFTVEQTGASLSMFYLMHKYFTSSLYTSAEKTYHYFKELMIRHSLAIPPDNIKIFSYNECKKVLQFFCSLYLKNLSLIRLLSLPNYGLYLEYHLEDEFVPEIKKQTKTKVEKKTKKEKKGKEKTAKKKKKQK